MSKVVFQQTIHNFLKAAGFKTVWNRSRTQVTVLLELLF